jgi:hypothetical protein
MTYRGGLRLLAIAALMCGLWGLEGSVVTTLIYYEIHITTRIF